MGLDHSGVLTVGTLVPKEGGYTLLHNTLLVIPPPGVESHRSLFAAQGAIGLAFPLWVTPHGIYPKTDPSPPHTQHTLGVGCSRS